MLTIVALLGRLIEMEGSDLHIIFRPGKPAGPYLGSRLEGQMIFDPIDRRDTLRLLDEVRRLQHSDLPKGMRAIRTQWVADEHVAIRALY